MANVLSVERLRAIGGRDELESAAGYALFIAATRFEPSRTSTRTGKPVKFQSFAIRCMLRVLWRVVNRRRNHLPVADLDFEILPSKDDGPHQEAERVELHAQIRRLHPRYRDIITRRYFEDATLRELADESGVTPEWVRYTEAQAVAKLASMIGADVPEAWAKIVAAKERNAERKQLGDPSTP